MALQSELDGLSKEQKEELLFLGARCLSQELIEKVLQAGVEVNAVNKEGASILHVLATVRENKLLNELYLGGTLRSLVHAGLDKTRSKGITAFQVAWDRGNRDTARYIEEEMCR